MLDKHCRAELGIGQYLTGNMANLDWNMVKILPRHVGQGSISDQSSVDEHFHLQRN